MKHKNHHQYKSQEVELIENIKSKTIDKYIKTHNIKQMFKNIADYELKSDR